MAKSSIAKKSAGQKTLAYWCVFGGAYLGFVTYIWGRHVLGDVLSAASSVFIFWLIAACHILTQTAARGVHPLPAIICILATTFCAPLLGLGLYAAGYSQPMLAMGLLVIGGLAGIGALSAWRAAGSGFAEPNGKNGFVPQSHHDTNREGV